MKPPVLVAHRGWCSRYPENTLPALAAALHAGAQWLEVDVQLSADGQPWLFHDRTLTRSTGREGRLVDLDAAAIRQLDACEPGRLGARFAGTPIPTLGEAAALLADWPDAQLFVELKRVSLERFGPDALLDRVMEELAPMRERAIPISFSAELVRAARVRWHADSAWILETLDSSSLAAARALDTSLLFADRKLLPAEGPLPAGPWRWAVFAVNTAAEAKSWADRGASFIETDCIGELLEDPALANWGQR